MKKVISLVVLLSVMVLNIPFLHHADIAEGVFFGHSHHATDFSWQLSDDNTDDHDKSKNALNAESGHHHHVPAFLPQIKIDHFFAASEAHYNWGAVNYLSQLHYPPSKPPKS